MEDFWEEVVRSPECVVPVVLKVVAPDGKIAMQIEWNLEKSSIEAPIESVVCIWIEVSKRRLEYEWLADLVEELGETELRNDMFVEVKSNIPTGRISVQEFCSKLAGVVARQKAKGSLVVTIDIHDYDEFLEILEKIDEANFDHCTISYDDPSILDRAVRTLRRKGFFTDLKNVL